MTKLIPIFSALSFVVIFFLILQRRRIGPYYDSLETLKKHFGGTVSKSSRFFLNQPSFSAILSGYRFSVTYITDESARPSGLRVVCYIPTSSQLKIFMYDKNPGVVFFAKRVQLGDRDFEKYFIYSNRPAEAVRYFADDARRNNIKKLIAAGWRPPRITGGKIMTYLADIEPKPIHDATTIRAAIESLIALRIENS